MTALKHSDANRFYLRHGFVLKAEGEWDLYYLRPARGGTKNAAVANPSAAPGEGCSTVACEQQRPG